MGKKEYYLGKEGQGTQEVFKDVAGSCRKKNGEVKAQSATSVKDNKIFFRKYINGKKRGKDNLHSLLWGANTVTKGGEKAKVFNTCFASFFNNKTLSSGHVF